MVMFGGFREQQTGFGVYVASGSSWPFFPFIIESPFSFVCGSTAALQGASRRNYRAFRNKPPPPPENLSGGRGGLFDSRQGQTAPPSGKKDEPEAAAGARKPVAAGWAEQKSGQGWRAYSPLP